MVVVVNPGHASGSSQPSLTLPYYHPRSTQSKSLPSFLRLLVWANSRDEQGAKLSHLHRKTMTGSPARCSSPFSEHTWAGQWQLFAGSRNPEPKQGVCCGLILQ
jgi:hypothetical protein